MLSENLFPVTDMIIITDLNGNYKFINKQAAEVLDINPQSDIQKNAFEIVHPDDFLKCEKAIEKSLKNNGEPTFLTVRKILKSGKEVTHKWKFIVNLTKQEIFFQSVKPSTKKIQIDVNTKQLIEENTYLKTALFALIHDYKSPLKSLTSLLENENIFNENEKEEVRQLLLDNLNNLNEKIRNFNKSIKLFLNENKIKEEIFKFSSKINE